MAERGFYEPIKVSDVNEDYKPDVELGRDGKLIAVVVLGGVLIAFDILIGVACLVVSIAK